MFRQPHAHIYNNRYTPSDLGRLLEIFAMVLKDPEARLEKSPHPRTRRDPIRLDRDFVAVLIQSPNFRESVEVATSVQGGNRHIGVRTYIGQAPCVGAGFFHPYYMANVPFDAADRTHLDELLRYLRAVESNLVDRKGLKSLKTDPRCRAFLPYVVEAALALCPEVTQYKAEIFCPSEYEPAKIVIDTEVGQFLLDDPDLIEKADEILPAHSFINGQGHRYLAFECTRTPHTFEINAGTIVELMKQLRDLDIPDEATIPAPLDLLSKSKRR